MELVCLFNVPLLNAPCDFLAELDGCYILRLPTYISNQNVACSF